MTDQTEATNWLNAHGLGDANGTDLDVPGRNETLMELLFASTGAPKVATYRYTAGDPEDARDSFDAFIFTFADGSGVLLVDHNAGLWTITDKGGEAENYSPYTN